VIPLQQATIDAVRKLRLQILSTTAAVFLSFLVRVIYSCM
jgi:hypothetical protein